MPQDDRTHSDNAYEPRTDENPNDVGTLEADRNAPPQEVVRVGGTFESFRHKDFTWFWSGALVSNTGTWMQTAALAIVVYALRKSETDLGIVNFMSGIPVLFLAIPGGLLADRVNKRQLLIWSQAILGLLAAALWLLYRAGRLDADHAVVALVSISAIGLLGGVFSALTFPAWQSFLPDLVPRDGLMNAIALNSAQFQSSRLLGPLAASGLLLVGISTGDIFLVNAASYLFVIAALWAVRPRPEAVEARRRQREAPSEGAWHTLTAGVRYAVDHKVTGTLILSTAVMTTFGMPYMMLLPAIADKSLHGANHGALLYIWLMAANGLGALFGSLMVAGLPSSINRERIIPRAIIGMAVALVAFSLTHIIWLSVVLSALNGAIFLTINSLTNTSIQATVPGQLRGRVMSLFVMSFMGIMPVSAIAFGPLGKWIGPANAVLGGAIVLLGWGIYLQASRRLHPEE